MKLSRNQMLAVALAVALVALALWLAFGRKGKKNTPSTPKSPDDEVCCKGMVGDKVMRRVTMKRSECEEETRRGMALRDEAIAKLESLESRTEEEDELLNTIRKTSAVLDEAPCPA
jgi:hypothetical protein